MKIANKKELQQIAINHQSDIDFKDFMKIQKKYTAGPYSFLVIDAALPSDNVPVVTLSTQYNAKLSQQLKSGLKRITNWNKCL